MKITFIGVGEACDPDHPNTSLLVQGRTGPGHILLDCGFTTPHLYFKGCTDPEQLAALWVSHFHGDHFFGVPLLLLRLWEMARRQPLSILGPSGVGQKIIAALELAYPGFSKRLGFVLNFLEVEPDLTVSVAGLTWQTAEGEHSQRNLAVRIEDGEKSLFYSGDGRPTPATLALAQGCDLAVHEAFGLAGDTPGHGSLKGCLEFAQAARIPHLALLHIRWHERLALQQEVDRLGRAPGVAKVFLPLAGDGLALC